MPSFQVLFHRLAIREYRSARNWYREQSVEVAERFAVAIDQAVSQIATRADMLPTLTASSRDIRVSRFPVTGHGEGAAICTSLCNKTTCANTATPVIKWVLKTQLLGL